MNLVKLTFLFVFRSHGSELVPVILSGHGSFFSSVQTRIRMWWKISSDINHEILSITLKQAVLSFFNTMHSYQFPCCFHLATVTMHQNLALSPSASILSFSQLATVPSGCGSKCPRLQFSQQGLCISVFWWLSRVRALVCSFVSSSSTSSWWYDSHKTHSLSSLPAFHVPLQTRKKTKSNLWHASVSIQMKLLNLVE